MKVTITSITIVRLPYHPDKVFLNTELPSAMPKVSTESAHFRLDCQALTAEEYCKHNFPGVPVELIVSKG